MAEVLRYINTASTAGGDGTTNDIVGANRAYASLGEWDSAEKTDLVAAGNTSRVLCSGAAAETGAWSNGAWTTDATHYVTIEANPNDPNGRNFTNQYSTSHYRFEVSTSGQAWSLSLINYTRIIGLQFKATSTGTAGRIVYIQASDFTLIDSCKIVYAGTDIGWEGINLQSASNDCCVRNCFVDGGGFDIVGLEIENSSLNDYAYNNTIVNCTEGIHSNGFVVAKNNLIYNCTTSYTGGFDAASDYNSTDNAQTTGGGNDRQNQTFAFVDAGAGDYGLLDSDVGAFNLGVDLSADVNCPVAVDNINTSRPQDDIYDIGAFETIVATPENGSKSQVLNFNRRISRLIAIRNPQLLRRIR